MSIGLSVLLTGHQRKALNDFAKVDGSMIWINRSWFLSPRLSAWLCLVGAALFAASKMPTCVLTLASKCRGSLTHYILNFSASVAAASFMHSVQFYVTFEGRSLLSFGATKEAGTVQWVCGGWRAVRSPILARTTSLAGAKASKRLDLPLPSTGKGKIYLYHTVKVVKVIW